MCGTAVSGGKAPHASWPVQEGSESKALFSLYVTSCLCGPVTHSGVISSQSSKILRKQKRFVLHCLTYSVTNLWPAQEYAVVCEQRDVIFRDSLGINNKNT